MSKENKISIRHYDNRKLKPKIINGEEIYPIYFQVAHLKKRYNFKSIYIENIFNNIDSKSFRWNENKERIISKDNVLIHNCIDKIIEDNSEFKINEFKEKYSEYFENYYSMLNDFQLLLISDNFENDELPTLRELINNKKIDAYNVVLLLKELSPTMFARIESLTSDYMRLIEQNGTVIIKSEWEKNGLEFNKYE